MLPKNVEEYKSAEVGTFSRDTINAYLKHLFDPDSDKYNKIYKSDVVKYYISNDTGVRMAPKRTREKCVTVYSEYGGDAELPAGGVDEIEEEIVCSTLSTDIVAKMLYMDVGRWGGKGKSIKNTEI